MTAKYAVVLKHTAARQTPTVGMTEIAARCHIHPEIVERFVRLGLVDPAGRDESRREWIFQPEVVPLVQKILRLRNELGINYSGIGVVLDLLSRIEQLEARLRDMENERSIVM